MTRNSEKRIWNKPIDQVFIIIVMAGRAPRTMKMIFLLALILCAMRYAPCAMRLFQGG
jgi:hypothetical protein